MKKSAVFVLALVAMSLFTGNYATAQLRYQSGRFLMGTSTPYYYYTMSVAGNGIYFNNTNGRYLQISVAATGAPRIAGHNDQADKITVRNVSVINGGGLKLVGNVEIYPSFLVEGGSSLEIKSH